MDCQGSKSRDQDSSLLLQGDRPSLGRLKTSVEAEDIYWLHPAEASIERLDAASRHAQLTPITHLTINSSTPLEEEHFRKALEHLCRKMPPLRTCFRERAGELWVCQYSEPKLDFHMKKAVDLTTEINRLIVSPFEDSSEGPLWGTLVMQAPPGAQCPLPELKKDFPHQYDLLLYSHHGITDGVTLMVVLSNLLKLLEDVVTGTPVSPSLYGKVVGEQQTMALEKEMLRRLESNPQFQNLVDEAAKAEFRPLLQQAFGTPPKPEFPMEFISTKFDPLIIQRFRDRCRAVGITFNSGFSSAINTALVELVAENGLDRDTYRVKSRHAISQMRYWKGDPLTDFGNHMGIISHTMETPRNNRAGFWDYAKKFDEEFRRKLKEGHVFKERIISSKIRPTDFNYDTFYSATPLTGYDHHLSNMNLSQFPNFGVGKAVQLTAIRMLSNISNCEFSNMHMLLSFRNTVSYNVMCDLGRVSREQTQALADKTVNVITSLVE